MAALFWGDSWLFALIVLLAFVWAHYTALRLLDKPPQQA